MAGKSELWAALSKFAVITTCAGTLCGGATFIIDGAIERQKRFDNIDAGIAQTNRLLETTARNQVADEQTISALRDKTAQHDTSIAMTAATVQRIDAATQSMSGQLAELYSYLLRNRHAGGPADHQTASSDR